jgi:hypothetical protein
MEAQPGVRLQRVILDLPASLQDLYWWGFEASAGTEERIV